MKSRVPRVLALAPSGQAHPGLVVAACRAGGMGILDFAIGFEAGRAIEAIRRVVGYVDRPFGLRLPGEALTGWLLGGAPEGLGVLICTEPADGDWAGPLTLARQAGRVALAEVTSRASARAAARAGADGLVVTGQEAGGRVGDETTFVLLQGILAGEGPPTWARGGIGPLGASACAAAGAAGVVLDGALWLARESPLDSPVRERLEHWDGSETAVLGRSVGLGYRLHAAPGSPALARLKVAEAQGRTAWEEAVRAEVGWRPDQAWPAGQDAAHAARLARRYVTVAGIVQAVERTMDEGPKVAHSLRSLAEGSGLAASHGTRYPIVQGPMTRVSDSVAFAESVADGGGLPFLALALMRGPEVRDLLAEAAGRLDGRAWGVGLLGFVPPGLRLEQVAAIREARPPFALIAGGRPDQAIDLEREGIATYLHVPSPALLVNFLREGARRFVVEGRECGGHVGPRSSSLLWEQAVEVILGGIDRGVSAAEIHLLFAGGIHDARSAAMMASLAAPAAARGVRIGALMGTAYLFTAEAVATGAIVADFQAEAVRCSGTVLLETGPGHEVRVSPTRFAETFQGERSRLLAEGRSHEEVRTVLEDLNVGRLRVATKGVERMEGAGSPIVPVPPDDRRARGLYMIGQVAALRDQVTTIAELHRDVAEGSLAWLERAVGGAIEAEAEPTSRPSDIAIVGMASIFPGAADVRTFWENTLKGLDAITEVPHDRWDWRLYYDPDPRAPDKISSKWGGFLPEVPFDPLRFGMPPASLPSIEPMHLLTLEVVRAALEDAGYRDRPFPRERTAVVLGAGGGAAQLAMGYAFRSYLPLLDTVMPGAGREAMARCGDRLPGWTEDSFPGILLNVAAGRVANRFDLGGANYTVDAACGSSLAAASLAVRELESGAADLVILGGADTVQNPFTYLAFSKTHAFSPKGRCRPFDAEADGIVISEGVAALILKRLADAERDGDRIYAVIKGLGASSDGRAKGLTAPHPRGQVRALRRAYAKAGVSPGTVGYVEAHGTGTAAGDLAEVDALAEVFGRAGTPRGACALGSVKSSIGHTKCAAGLAGLINASLALYHKVLPPTIGVTRPNPRSRLEESPFHISATTRPWLHGEADVPRRAGVSAFGFGGTNFHAVLEAHERDPIDPPAPVREWPAELLVWKAPDRERLAADLDRVLRALAGGARPALRDLAHTLLPAAGSSAGGQGPALAIVASTLDDLGEKLAGARRALAGGLARLEDPRGIYFAEQPGIAGARVAFLFPGQGSQYPGMLGDLAVSFAEVRRGFDDFDVALRALGGRPVGPLVFPPPAFRDDRREEQRAALYPPDLAQPAVGAACLGLLNLLGSLGLEPDLLAGHSYGELVALHAAGSLSMAALAELSEARGRLILASAGDETGAMAALAAGPAQVLAVLEGLDDVLPVNWNGPGQTVLSGTREAVAQAVERARELGLRAQILPVACAFHSPLVAGARDPLAALVRGLGPTAPRKSVYSNVTAAPYPAGPEAIANQLGDHLVRPVRFAEMIDAMYADGARVFVEVGPAGIVAALTESILAGRPHLALACDHPGRPGLPVLLHALGRLAVSGVRLRLDRLTAGRSARRLDPHRFEVDRGTEAISPSTWLVNGARARPAHGPAVAPFGQGPALPVPETAAQGHLPVAPPAHRDGASSHPRIPSGDNPAGRIPDPSGADRVVEAFQRNMQAFLNLQRKTMLDYLAGRDSSAVAPVLAREPGDRPPDPVPGVEAAPHETPSGTNGRDDHSRGAIKTDVADVLVTSSRIGREALSHRLLVLVQERTGYPSEMLRLDLDLEADLGIDSIKRVEILGSLRDSFPSLDFGTDSRVMDQLSHARTLGEIVDRLGEDLDRRGRAVTRTDDTPAEVASSPSQADPSGGRIGSSRAPAPGGPVVTPFPSNGNGRAIGPHSGPVRRLLLEVVEHPLPPGQARLATGGVVLVTDDGRGIARAVAADLRALGHPVVRVRHGPAGDGDEGINLTSPAAVAALLDRIRGRGELAGIVHALPLREQPSAGLDPEAWAKRLSVEVRGLFLLARAAADDLARAADRGGACLIAATGMGGTFASAGPPPADFFPGQGGVAGLVKTLAREWPGVRARVVDTDPSAEVEVLAADLVREVLADDRRSEVGYRGGRRVTLAYAPAPLPDLAGRGVALEEGDPLLVTGGARGITAAVVADLALRWRPTLLLVGTSPPPPDEEDSATAGLASSSEIKAALHARLGLGGRPVGPADVERSYRDLVREREIRGNLRAFRRAGAQVEYAQADVRDADALGRALAAWRRRHGPVRALIHGAGLIQDKLLCDKTPESFDRVVGTKLEGALLLAGLLRADPLRFAAFFSSVAGRFGNRGQADYAAANEALNKLAIWLDRRWPCRVVSILWGPWSGVGMVSDLESHLARRGMTMIPPELGCSRLADELQFGRKGDVEVILAGDLGALERPAGRRNAEVAR